jgi:broad specificity phosphatase PhoE
MNIYFIRHAESLKSIQKRHGGEGLPITEQGKNDTIELLCFLENQENVNFHNSLFFCSDRVQVKETATFIENQKQVIFQIEFALKNISLGVLDGLSDEEAMQEYPVEAGNLGKWRKGELKIEDFTIPNAETMEQFYSRIFNFISSLVQQDKDVFIIGTRSVGVAITNIFTNFQSEMDKDNYQRFLFDPSSISKFAYEGNTPDILYINKTDFLSVKPQYPDQ